MPDPTQKPGKPTIQQNNHDENVGQRESTATKQPGAKPGLDPERELESGPERDVETDSDRDNGGKNYGQRSGSTVTEDNDVE